MNSVFGVSAEALADLAEATPASEIKTRKAFAKRDGRTVVQKNPDGTDMELAYVDARFVQERLDSTVGPANWQSAYQDTPGGVRCGIGIYVGGVWVWKWDVGIPSNIEPVKGAHSDAFKRAAVQWGIARDLYEERDEPAAPAPGPERPVREAVSSSRSQRYAARTDEDERVQDDEDEGDWVCPIHNAVKEVPAGISKKSGKRYSAFLACPEYGCDEKEPRR